MMVRKAKLSDLDVIMQLQQDSFGLVVVPKRRIIAHRLTGIPYYLLFDENNGKLIGYIAIMRKTSDVYLASIAITKANQSMGYGAKALDWLISIGNSMNKDTVSLHTSVENIGMLTLAEKFGFVETERIKNYYARGYLNGDAVKMVKVLG